MGHRFRFSLLSEHLLGMLLSPLEAVKTLFYPTSPCLPSSYVDSLDVYELADAEGGQLAAVA